jgi:hypothetical protein
MATTMKLGEIAASRKWLACALGAALALSGANAFAATRAASFGEASDPPRWYVPADTPQRKYDNAVREARNALAEQLKECRASHQRKRCESDARAQYREDMARARDFLAPTRQLA